MVIIDFFKAVARTWKQVNSLSLVDQTGGTGGWFSIVREAWAGAWQGNNVIDAPKNILAFSAVFSSVTIIASDIAKLCMYLVEEEESTGLCTRVTNSPFLRVLKKPNRYQNRFKFVEQWIVSKLLYGNTYALKERDNRGVVTALYILDAQRVKTLIADNGDVYYELTKDALAGIEEATTVPANEIIHDMMVSLWHPLMGVSPIYACAVSATMGNKITNNSTKFFDNMSRPSGVLTAPGTISDEVATRLKKEWEVNFSGSNIGRVAVLGDALKYEAMAVPAQEAQLIEQLQWTVEDVARCFHVPLFKLGGTIPVGNTVETLNQTYYSDCLQALIESAETCLDEGLELPADYCVQFDLKGLLRMDTRTRYEAKSAGVKGGWMTPNEARRDEQLPPLPGGDSAYLQQQNFSLEALAKRDAQDDPFATKATPAPSQPEQEPEEDQAAQALVLIGELKMLIGTAKQLALPAPLPEPEEENEVEQFANAFIKGLSAT